MKTTPAFIPIPEDPALSLVWPTGNRDLFHHPDLFFARTRANPDFGRPGWTRDCGQRFHRGCDIAPVRPIPTGETTEVMFTDCATGREYPSREPTWRPDDNVFAVADGEVAEINRQPNDSTLGIFMMIRHRWPTGGGVFFSLYAHLDSVSVTIHTRVAAGQIIGRMGQTSSSADARNWMAIAPHLHLEFWDEQQRVFNPEAMLRRYMAPDAT